MSCYYTAKIAIIIQKGMNPLKRFIWFSLLLSTLFIISGCQAKESTKMPPLTENIYESLVADKQTYFLYVGSDGCPYCQEFKPKLMSALQQEDAVVYYLDADKASDDFKRKLAQDLAIQSIPYLAQIKGDHVVEQLPDYSSLTIEDIRQFLN